MAYTVLSHPGDLKLRVTARTQAALFSQTAKAMFLEMVPGLLAKKGASVTRTVKLSGTDPETLFIDFLNELLYLAQVHQEFYRRCDVTLSPKGLAAKLTGIKHSERARLEIKAATFSELSITHERGCWVAQVVFDI